MSVVLRWDGWLQTGRRLIGQCGLDYLLVDQRVACRHSGPPMGSGDCHASALWYYGRSARALPVRHRRRTPVAFLPPPPPHPPLPPAAALAGCARREGGAPLAAWFQRAAFRHHLPR